MLTHTNHLPVSDYFIKPKNSIAFYANREDFNEVKVININDLHPNQWTIDEECLKRKIKGKNLSLVYVVYIRGIYVLIDGHHTVVAKLLNGQKKVKCKLSIIT